MLPPTLFPHCPAAGAPVESVDVAKHQVLTALSQIIDPDFGTDIVSCGFVKDLLINEALEEVLNSALVFDCFMRCPLIDQNFRFRFGWS